MLHYGGITVRAWKEADLPLLHELRNDRELQVQLMSRAKPNSLASVREWLARKSSEGVFFVIADKEDNALGFVQATIEANATMGICVHESARRKGVAAIAIGLLQNYLAETMLVHKLMLEVLKSNAVAISVYTRAGFREVGTLARHFRVGRDWHDVLIMEKLL